MRCRRADKLINLFAINVVIKCGHKIRDKIQSCLVPAAKDWIRMYVMFALVENTKFYKSRRAMPFLVHTDNAAFKLSLSTRN